MPQTAVIGPGRVGRAIASMLTPPHTALLLGRNQQLPQHFKGPVFVCTTNDALDEVLKQVQPSQHGQLVFTQNGMLLPWLRAHGLQQRATQVLLYMSATADGRVTDGGRSCAGGPLAAEAAALLAAGGVACSVADEPAFARAALAKLLWSSTFWLMSAGLGGATVGSIVQQHASELEALTAELLPIGQRYLLSTAGDGVAPSPAAATSAEDPASPRGGSVSSSSSVASSEQQQQEGQELSLPAVLAAMTSYSLAIADAVPSKQMARREFAWRNGFFLQQQVTPLHRQWLLRAGCQDLLLEAAG